jgi:hypothetical protein
MLIIYTGPVPTAVPAQCSTIRMNNDYCTLQLLTLDAIIIITNHAIGETSVGVTTQMEGRTKL